MLGSSQGLVEDFKDGSFRLRPSNDMLTELKTVYFKKSVFTGCANGNSAQYNLYFYRQKCSQLSVTTIGSKPVLEYFYKVEN